MCEPRPRVHPWEAPRYASTLETLGPVLDEARLVGEVGLDHHFVTDEEQHPGQRVVFDYFLDAAEVSGRLINVYTTVADSEVLGALRARALPAVIIIGSSGRCR
ncbi:MAG: TatD family hydrolase [Gemmatimonadetes bacterium]|nr:TatD family hydrolase [Gemmatimonadota bacterium]